MSTQQHNIPAREINRAPAVIHLRHMSTLFSVVGHTRPDVSATEPTGILVIAD